MIRDEREPWTNDRWEELELLERLLVECESLDSSNRTIWRLGFLIETAKKLRTWDSATRRTSFLRFLQAYAIAGSVPVEAEVEDDHA